MGNTHPQTPPRQIKGQQRPKDPPKVITKKEKKEKKKQDRNDARWDVLESLDFD